MDRNKRDAYRLLSVMSDTCCSVASSEQFLADAAALPSAPAALAYNRVTTNTHYRCYLNCR